MPLLDREDRIPCRCYGISGSWRSQSLLLPGSRFKSFGFLFDSSTFQDQAYLSDHDNEKSDEKIMAFGVTYPRDRMGRGYLRLRDMSFSYLPIAWSLPCWSPSGGVPMFQGTYLPELSIISMAETYTKSQFRIYEVLVNLSNLVRALHFCACVNTVSARVHGRGLCLPSQHQVELAVNWCTPPDELRCGS